MADIILMAETGSDIPPAMASRLGIELVPMHVTIGDRTLDDGDIEPAEMLEQCRQLGVLPHTSGSTPQDFAGAFDRLHAARPEAQILYLAYSAVTTCSFESARIASEGRPYVTAVDTQQVTIGQGFVVTGVRAWLDGHPDATIEQAAAFARDLAARTRMAFIPSDLGYLRAGGRLSNAAFVGATLLKIKPVIELIEGKLVATKRLRGKMDRAAVELLDLMVEREGSAAVDTDRIFFVRTCGLPPQVEEAVDARARAAGFQDVSWFDTGNVITAHGGPGAFGIAFAVEG